MSGSEHRARYVPCNWFRIDWHVWQVAMCRPLFVTVYSVVTGGGCRLVPYVPAMVFPMDIVLVGN